MSSSFADFLKNYDKDESYNTIKNIENSREKVIFRDDFNMKFSLLSYQEYKEYYMRYLDKCKEKNNFPHLHEIVGPTTICRVVFDIDLHELNHKLVEDMSSHIIEQSMYFYENLISQDPTNEYFIYNQKINESSFVICESDNSKKLSRHILTPLYCRNYLIAKHAFSIIRNVVIEKLSEIGYITNDLEKILDGGMHKKWGSLRMPFSSKIKDPQRVKNYMGDFDDLPDVGALMIGWYETTKPPIYISDIADANLNQYLINSEVVVENPDDILKIENLAQSHVNDFKSVWKFRNQSGNMYFYKRLRPSYCDICNRSHDNDNTLYFRIGNSATKPVYLHCIKNKEHGSKIGNLENSISPEEIFNHNMKQILDTSEYSNPLTSWCEKQKIQKQNIVVKNEILDPKECIDSNYSTCMIKAFMKMGKTKMLIKHIKSLCKENPNASIIFVSFRQTFTSSLLARLNEELEESGIMFNSYQNIEEYKIYSENYPHLIIQVDSINRLEPTTERPTLVILDEIESILSQYSSPLIKDIEGCYAVFEWLIQSAENIVCMDANLSVRSLNLMKKWRGLENMKIYQNLYENAKDEKVIIVPTKEILTKLFVDAAQKNKKIAVATNSVNFARTFAETVIKHFDSHDLVRNVVMKLEEEEEILTESKTSHENETKKFAIYSSETSPHIKERHFKDVSKYWSDVDVLIFTPTVTAGISYEEEHFDMMFSYFTDKSCDVETSRQMNGRIRNLKDKTTYVCIDYTKSNYPTSPKTISRCLRNLKNTFKQLGVNKDIKSPPIQISYSLDGEKEYTELRFFDLWVENLCFKNKSKNNFLAEFVSQTLETGAQIIIHEDEINDTTVDYKEMKDCAEIRRGEVLVECEKINDEYFEELRNIMNGTKSNIFVKQSVKDRFDKTRICKWYSLPPNLLNPGNKEEYALAAFLEKSSNMMIYKNLTDIKPLLIECPEDVDPISRLDEILENIRSKEFQLRANIVKFRSLTADISIDQVYFKHRETWEILKNLQYYTIASQSGIPNSRVVNYIKSISSDVEKINKISLLFGVQSFRANGSDYCVKIAEKNIKQILSDMYGLVLKKYGKKENARWSISPNSILFELASKT